LLSSTGACARADAVAMSDTANKAAGTAIERRMNEYFIGVCS
jgi:hypothetical protein